MMLGTVAIPDVDPLGLPAASGLLVFLHVLTLFLHMVFMNFVLGGSILALGLNVAALTGRHWANEMARIIYQSMPVVISMAITMGVAPLLFVQALYGPFFYTANVLLGFVWFSFLVLLLFGFYLTYVLTYKGSNSLLGRVGAWDQRPQRRLIVSVVTTLCFMGIAWILTNNHELTTRPEAWAMGEQWGKSRLFADSPTTVIRYLHNLTGAMLVASFWLVAIGYWRLWRKLGVEQANRDLGGLGLRLAMVLAPVQVVLGVVFLFKMERPLVGQLAGFNSVLSTGWTLAVVLALVVVGLLALMWLKQDHRWLYAAAGVGPLVLAGMLMGHERLRLALLGRPEGEHFTLQKWPIFSQSSPTILFFVTLVIALGTVALILWWFQDRSPAGLPETDNAPGGAPTPLSAFDGGSPPPADPPG